MQDGSAMDPLWNHAWFQGSKERMKGDERDTCKCFSSWKLHEFYITFKTCAKFIFLFFI